ncbi:Protein WBSCR14-like protein [Colletotrichum sidae]|uniref:Protein WBSCR14-like protein n=1 Tax=Colletotrichum sidae TaxID=1347389 RepID=A0A4R8TIJ4_9PEZI|nr:Protein WBSCR14-like protein [Colletotrichum sidae]
MGSTQPPDPTLPFGYAVDPSSDLFLDPPEPASPGQNLLDENETKTLSTFFDLLSGNEDAYMPSYGEGLGPGLGFADLWSSSLPFPPMFVGSTTSYGQSPAASLLSPGHGSHGVSLAEYSDVMSVASGFMLPPPPPQQQQQLSQQQQQPSQLQPQPQSHQILDQQQQQQQQPPQPSAEVLAAATVLQNGSSRSSAASSGALFNNNNNNREISQSRGPPVGHLRHQPLEEFKRAERGSVVQASFVESDDATLADMFFSAAPGERATAQRTSHVPNDIQWGSDARFSRSADGFVPDPKESYEALSNGQLMYMGCLQQSQSTDTTRPTSPSGEAKGHSRKSSEVLKKEEDADAPPRKRRKSRNTKDEVEDEDEDSGPSTKAARKRKTKPEPAAGTPPKENGAAGRRRKSGTGAKPPRENLTDAQKRENHIRSEQKRRTLIKEGFDDLCDLVPGLRGGGFSKSTMLTMAAEWLEAMLKGNDELRAQLT